MTITLVQQHHLTVVDLVVDYGKDLIVISYFVGDGDMQVAEIETAYLVEYLKCFHPDYLAEFFYKSSNGNKELNLLEDFKRKNALKKRFLLYYLNK